MGNIRFMCVLFFTILHALISLPIPSSGAPDVRLIVESGHVVIDNGIFQLTLTNPTGAIAAISYNGNDNLLEVRDSELRRGYWDISWTQVAAEQKVAGSDGWRLESDKFSVIQQNKDLVEVSFSRTWNPSLKGLLPLNVDKRFIVLRGSSGFYSYGIYEHQQGWPDLNIYEARIALKLNKETFHYMAVADNRQRFMPLPDDRLQGRAVPLSFKEAVLMTNPVEPDFKGEVDDKYQYSMDNQDSKVHGWISSHLSVGLWMITPSNEFKTGGPFKQDLTSHTGPITLSMFVSVHYTGDDLKVKLRNGEHWKKVVGPVFVYLNSNPDTKKLWEDAKTQMQREVKSWPYSFPASVDFLKANQRGSVSGRLLVRDRYIKPEDMPASAAYVGLALPGEPGSWQTESKGYQFWTRADSSGFFFISNVRPGVYNLYASVPGFIGDYKFVAPITINPGSSIRLNDLVYEPPREGPTLWEIGVPDRTAAEFYIPDPRPEYVNKLYINHPERFRQYGLWLRYTDLYPKGDLVYTVGRSDYRKDWFFAQVNRVTGNAAKPFAETTWQIRFNLDNVIPNKTYKLRLAIASATDASVHVWFNTIQATPHFSTQHIRAENNAIARHAIHGMYWLFSGDIPSNLLVKGQNVIFLTQTFAESEFSGVQYDYIRLEGPSA